MKWDTWSSFAGNAEPSAGRRSSLRGATKGAEPGPTLGCGSENCSRIYRPWKQDSWPDRAMAGLWRQRAGEPKSKVENFGRNAPTTRRRGKGAARLPQTGTVTGAEDVGRRAEERSRAGTRVAWLSRGHSGGSRTRGGRGATVVPACLPSLWATSSPLPRPIPLSSVLSADRPGRGASGVRPDRTEVGRLACLRDRGLESQ